MNPTVQQFLHNGHTISVSRGTCRDSRTVVKVWSFSSGRMMHTATVTTTTLPEVLDELMGGVKGLAVSVADAIDRGHFPTSRRPLMENLRASDWMNLSNPNTP